MILDSNILVGVLAICVLAVTADLFHLRRKLKKMLRGQDNKNLGEAMIAVGKDVQEIEKFRKDMETYLLTVEKRLRRATQAAETVRFNAFRGDGLGGTTGGNQSFATAFLNEDGDGSVLSSLYTRERVSVYAKPIARFESADAPLSEEERRAVALAQAKLGAK